MCMNLVFLPQFAFIILKQRITETSWTLIYLNSWQRRELCGTVFKGEGQIDRIAVTVCSLVGVQVTLRR